MLDSSLNCGGAYQHMALFSDKFVTGGTRAELSCKGFAQSVDIFAPFSVARLLKTQLLSPSSTSSFYFIAQVNLVRCSYHHHDPLPVTKKNSVTMATT